MYRRFSGDHFTVCLEDKVSATALHAAVTSQSLWDEQVVPLSLPPHIDIVLGDVCGGSSSTSMVL